MSGAQAVHVSEPGTLEAVPGAQGAQTVFAFGVHAVAVRLPAAQTAQAWQVPLSR